MCMYVTCRPIHKYTIYLFLYTYTSINVHILIEETRETEQLRDKTMLKYRENKT